MNTVLSSEETAGVVGVTRLSAVSGERAPRHIHAHEDELFIVIAGELRVSAGERDSLVGAGATAFLPRGIPHKYEVISDEADVLITMLPGGFEKFFMNAGYPIGREGEVSDNAPVGKLWDVHRTKRISEELGLGITWLE